MPIASTCAPAQVCNVMVVGLKGDQFSVLNSLLPRDRVRIREVSPEKFLRIDRFSGVVLLTRFTGHKHQQHAGRIAPGRTLRVAHGGAQAVADAILVHIGLDDEESRGEACSDNGGIRKHRAAHTFERTAEVPSLDLSSSNN